MNRQLLIKTTAVLLVVVAVTLMVKSILLQGAPVVKLEPAPALAGSISQSLGTSGGKASLQVAGKDYSLRDIRYFSDGQWAAVTVVPTHSKGDTVVVVLEKIKGDYQAVLGPGNLFSSSYSYTLPTEIVQYLSQRGYLHG